MFDHLVAQATPGRRKLRALLLAGAVAAHAIALSALAIAGMWRLDKLDVDTGGRVVASFALPGDPGGGGAPKAEPLVKKAEPARKKVIPKEPVQPERAADDPVDVETTTEPTSDGDDAAAADGPPGNGTGGDGTGFGIPTGSGCTQPPCGAGDRTDPRDSPKPEPPKKVETHTISPDIAAGLRLSGNDRIAAPDPVRVQMLRDGKSRVVGTVKLCIGTDGRVSSARILKSTGYDAYDARLLSEMRQWRYQPYTVDGRAAPACTAVTLVYVMKK